MSTKKFLGTDHDSVDSTSLENIVTSLESDNSNNILNINELLTKVANAEDRGQITDTIKVIDNLSNLNTVVDSGFYYVPSSGVTNTPGLGVGTLLVISISSTRVTQIFFSSSTDSNIAIRNSINGTFSSWVIVPQVLSSIGTSTTNTMSQLSISNALTNYLPLTGGSITGSLVVSNNVSASGFTTNGYTISIVEE